ncbi:MAG: transcription termination factor Rho [Acidimicrobiales bacterium]
MSLAPQALERSVLESKEREELAAIAEAMGVKPSPRASKTTLIDHILREAGIETAPERARRPRSSKPDLATNGAGSPAGGDTADTAGTAVDAAATPANGSASGGGAGVLAPPEPDTLPGTSPDGPVTIPSEPSSPDPERPGPDAPDEPEPGTSGPAEPSQPAAPSPADGGRPTQAIPAGDNTAPALAMGSDGGQADAGGGTRIDERPRNHDHRTGQGQSQGQSQGQGQGQGFDNTDGGNRRSSRRRRGRDRGDRAMAPQGGGDDVAYSGEPMAAEGLVDLHEKGYGFLRTAGYLSSPRDVYVSVSQVRRFGLRKGDYVKGASRPAGNNEAWPALLRIDTVSDMSPDEARQRPKFEELTPLFPDQRLRLEVPGETTNMVARIVDLISPIGKGQRGLIVSPPKAGKTTVLKQIAHSIETNNPDVHLMVLLVDERPEEVTDMRRSVKGEVAASTFDRPSEEHTQVAELTLERAKRLVETGADVVIVLDGITRLSRAYNLAAPATGRIMSGGIDVGALYPPKKFFGSARNIEEGGSLTILATALVETGSRMDEVIFEEFKGTGNMELRLDRKLAERRIYPALDVNASSTRHEELLFERTQLQQVWKLRRVLNALEGGAGLELLMDKIRNTKSNDEFLAEIAKAPAPTG